MQNRYTYTHTQRFRGGSGVHTLLFSCLYGLVSLCKSLYFVRICFMYYLAFLINVRNGSRRVFVVHLICDCCRARVVSCYVITWWRNPNVPVCLMFCVICSVSCELDQFPRDILNIVKLSTDHVLSMESDFYGTSLNFSTLYWWNLH